MIEKLEMAFEELDRWANNRPREFYHQVIKGLTFDVVHAAKHMGPEDLEILEVFAGAVKLLQKRDKEKK